MRKFVYLVTLIFLLSMAGPASADWVYRCGSGDLDPCDPQPWRWHPEVSSAWSDGDNWVRWIEGVATYGVPTAADMTILNRGLTYPVLIDSGTDADAAELRVGFWPDALLDVTGGTLDVVGMLSVGMAGDGEEGYMNISGGAITAGGDFVIGGEDPYHDPCTLYGSGDGYVSMSDGTVDVTGDLLIGLHAGTGDLTLTGGTITADDLNMTANGSALVSGTGMIILSGNDTGVVQPYIDSGWLSGEAWYDPGPGKTYITPEPATLALLGMGGLVLLRRKR